MGRPWASKLTGALVIDEARYRIARQAAAEVVELAGVRDRLKVELSKLAAKMETYEQAQGERLYLALQLLFHPCMAAIVPEAAILQQQVGKLLPLAAQTPRQTQEDDYTRYELLAPETAHAAYAEAGARLLTTNTFGGTKPRLDMHGLGDRVVELVQDVEDLLQARRRTHRAIRDREVRMNELRKTFHTDLEHAKQELISLAASVTESIPRATAVLLVGDLELRGARRPGRGRRAASQALDQPLGQKGA